MKHYLFLALFFLFNLSAEAQSGHWTLVRIDKQLSINFPKAAQELDIPAILATADAPNQHDPQAQASRAFRSEDITAVYAVVVVPYSGKSQVPNDLASREAYYKYRLAPMLVARAHGELLSYNGSVKDGVHILTIKFRALGVGGKPVIKYMQTFTVDCSIYELFFSPKDGLGETCVAERHRFFDTAVITPTKK